MPEPTAPGELSRSRRANVKPKPSKLSKPVRPVAAQSDVVLFGIALSYLLLGLLKAANVIGIDSPVLASFSLAGMCFALSDLAKLGVHSGPLASRLFFRFFYFVSLLACSLCLIVVPLSYPYIGWLGSVMVPLGDMSALTGMGVIIGLIVINNLLLRGKRRTDATEIVPSAGTDEAAAGRADR